MKAVFVFAIALVTCFTISVVASVARAADTPDADGFIALFDGKSLEGWTPSENKETWHIEDGCLVSGGPRSHLFYSGPVHDHDFKNFELKADVMTKPGSNSGIYFHTEYQESDWPFHGYEAQVNNTHSDWKRTGGLYDVQDIRETPVKDDEWFEYDVSVLDKHIVLKINGQTTVDYTEPEGGPKVKEKPGRMLSHGTIALQGHDPKSKVYFKNVRIKPLP
jgi:3-keto-disaccharide hydrolase